MEVKFDKDKFTVGDVHYKSKVTLQAECIEGMDRIHYVYGTCSCTQPKMEGNSLIVDFDVNAAVGNLSSGEFKALPKYVSVYLDPEVPEWIPDPVTKKKVFNTNKLIVQIPINFRAYG